MKSVGKMSFKTIRDDRSIAEENILIEEIHDADDAGAMQIFKDIRPNCFGNLPVSLFWEEKLILIIKFYQLLGFTVILFFEEWPSQYQALSGYFCAATLNIYMVLGKNSYGGDGATAKQTQYYFMLENFDPNFWTYLYHYSGLVAIILIGVLMFFNKKINNWSLIQIGRQVQFFNMFKLYMWLVEIVQFPILINLVQTGVCKYSTDKILYQSVNCYNRDNWTWLTKTIPAQIIGYDEDDIDMGSIKAIMYWMTFSAGATILIYNLVVLAHIYSESVSIVKSERYIIKKEVEFCLGISYNWLTSYFFYFSSFSPGLWK